MTYPSQASLQASLIVGGKKSSLSLRMKNVADPGLLRMLHHRENLSSQAEKAGNSQYCPCFTSKAWTSLVCGVPFHTGSPTSIESTSLCAARCPQLSRHCNAALRHPCWGGGCLQYALHPWKEVGKSAELQQAFHMVLCWTEFDNFQNKYVWVSDPAKYPSFSICACAWHSVLPQSPCLPPSCCSHFSLSFSQSLKVTLTTPSPQLPCVIPVWWSFTPFLGLLLCLFSTWWFPGVEEYFHPLLMLFSAL